MGYQAFILCPEARGARELNLETSAEMRMVVLQRAVCNFGR